MVFGKPSGFVATLVVVAVVLTLAGCTPKYLMGARATAETVEFMSCDSASTQTIEVWAASVDDKTRKYNLVWKTTGEMQRSAGDVVKYGIDPTGMTTEFGPLLFDLEQSTVAISFEQIDSSGQLAAEVQAIFSGAELSSTNWLDESGNSSSDPCQ